jgi:hypothetical protein
VVFVGCFGHLSPSFPTRSSALLRGDRRRPGSDRRSEPSARLQRRLTFCRRALLKRFEHHSPLCEGAARSPREGDQPYSRAVARAGAKCMKVITGPVVVARVISMQRRAFGAMLLLTLFIASVSCDAQDPVPAQPDDGKRIPSRLLGDWCGGLNSAPEGHWTYTFMPDAKFVHSNRQRGATSGRFAVKGSLITLLVEGKQPSSMTWSIYKSDIDFVSEILLLDSVSYVRGRC